MNNGAFGENFPYSNFHDLNMDWIIKIVKEFNDNYSTIEEHITTGVGNIEYAKEESITEINETTDEAISRLNHIVTNSTRRIILIGDSYFNRVNSSSKTIPEIVQPIIGYSNDNYYYSSASGGAFAHADTNYTFLHILQQLYPSISNPETITDIYVCCGANDSLYTYQNNRNAIIAFKNWCKTNLPKAMIKIVPWGVTFDSESKFYRTIRALKAFRSCAEFGIKTIKNAEYILCNTTLLATDRCHPNSEYGVDALASSLAGIIQTDETDDAHYEYTLSNLTTTLTMDNLTDPIVVSSFNFDNARMARDNENVIITQVNNYSFGTIIFNVNHPTINQTNYIHITLNDSVACGRIISTGSVNSPSFLAEIVDAVDTSKRCPALVSVKYNSTANKYEILVRPQSSFTLSQNNNIIWLYLSFSYTD